MIMNKKIIYFLLLFITNAAFAQTGSIGIGTTTPNSQAMLDIQSSSKGVLIPRLTASQRSAISNPANGLIVYDSTLGKFYFAQNNSWFGMIADTGSADAYWHKLGDNGAIKNIIAGGLVSPDSSIVLIDPGISTPPASGAGTRLMWFPAKSAFRAGTVSDTAWNASNLGTWSTATGVNTMASGNYSTAMGVGVIASGTSSTAMVQGTLSNGFSTTAMGHYTTASGNYSIATGENSIASGLASVAFGFYSNALGDLSTALGSGGTASGYASTVMGFNSRSSGDYSTAMGYHTTARAYGSTALGFNNDSIISSNPTSIISSDPLFYI